MPDAAEFGDEGSDTYGNIVRETGLVLPNLVSYGLNNIDGVAKVFPNGNKLEGIQNPIGAYARLSEKTHAKDTTADITKWPGLVLAHPFRVFPNAFPENVVKMIENAAGVQFMGNEVASGTEIIQRLGEEHLKTARPILYTSQDSVLQIAADTSVIPLQRLYEICEKVRAVMTGEFAVGRVIARPFVHANGKFYQNGGQKGLRSRTSRGNAPRQAVSKGSARGFRGQDRRYFLRSGISESHHTGNNEEGLEVLLQLSETLSDGFVFVNLVDTDMLYGHRNNVLGYAQALKEIDGKIRLLFIKNLQSDDLLLITADHGVRSHHAVYRSFEGVCPSSDSREKIGPKNLGTVRGFDCIADLIAVRYGFTEKQ